MWFSIIAMADTLMDDRRRAADRIAATAALLRDTPARRSRLRHAAALGLAAVSRSSARAVRRLDACLGDDLGRQLAAARRG